MMYQCNKNMKECSCYPSVSVLTELVIVKYRCAFYNLYFSLYYIIYNRQSRPLTPFLVICPMWSHHSASSLRFLFCFFLRGNCFVGSCKLSVSMGGNESVNLPMSLFWALILYAFISNWFVSVFTHQNRLHILLRNWLFILCNSDLYLDLSKSIFLIVCHSYIVFHSINYHNYL